MKSGSYGGFNDLIQKMINYNMDAYSRQCQVEKAGIDLEEDKSITAFLNTTNLNILVPTIG